MFIDVELISNAEKQIPVLMHEMREVLSPDGKGDDFEKLRERGLVVWSTCAWDEEKREMSAWMDEKFVDSMLSGDRKENVK